MKKGAFFALMLLFLGACHCAESAKRIDAYIEITPNLEIYQRLNYTIYANDEKNLSSVLLMMPYMPERFDVLDSDMMFVNYSTSISNGIFVIKINDFMAAGSEKNYIVRTYADSFVATFGPSNIFTYTFLSYYDLEEFCLKLILPSNYAIISSQGNPISPLPNRLYSSNDGIILEWSQRINYMDSKSFFVFFEKSASSNYTWLIIVLTFVLSFLIGAGTIYFFIRKSKAKTLTQVLSKDEKSIVNLLLENKDLTQKDIGQILDLSKPKLSKLISGLSKKGILSIVPDGRKNRIELRKEVL